LREHWTILIAVAIGTGACTPPSPNPSKEQFAFDRKRDREARSPGRITNTRGIPSGPFVPSATVKKK